MNSPFARGLKAASVSASSPSLLAQAVQEWINARQGSERVVDVQYLTTTARDPNGADPDTHLYAAMILFTTQ